MSKGKAGKLVGGFVVATGIVVMGAVVASGAAIGALMKSFKTAGNAFIEVVDEGSTEQKAGNENTEQTVITKTEVIN